MYNWNGKKLLILGATKLLCQVVDVAHRYGAKVVAIDYFENSPAKKIADESYLISTIDVDKVVELIKEKHIDGIVTGFMDSMMPYYKEICERTGLPSYITTDEQITFTTEKQVFKNYLKEFDIPFVEDFETASAVKEFPVIVKPVDNSGARGISICNNEVELQKGIELALEFSKSKKYLIEKYLTCKEATVFYLFVDGKSYFTFMGDRHVAPVKDGFIKLPTGYSFPSKGTEYFEKELHPKFEKMFEKLQIKNGMMFLQCFIDEDGKCIPYEPGFRLTGSLEYILLDKVCGYNPMAMMINYAFTGKMTNSDELSKINPMVNKKCYNISCLLKPGTIKEIKGVEELEKTDGIVEVFKTYEVGDTLPPDVWGKLAQIGLRLFVVPRDEDNYKRIQKEIEAKLCVLSEQGENMIINYNIEE